MEFSLISGRRKTYDEITPNDHLKHLKWTVNRLCFTF